MRNSTARILFLCWIAAGSGSADAAGRPEQSRRVTILHTNDMHGQYVPSDRQGGGGGLEALDAVVRSQTDERTLLLDAGDSQTGTLLSRLTVDGAAGGGMVRLMNAIGYRAACPGNHDFDEGWQNLLRLKDVAAFDLLSANLTRDGALLTGKAHAIVNVGGVKTGIIGLTSKELYSLVFPGRLGGIKVKDPAASAREWIRKIDPETDLIVLLTHQGFSEDSLLAMAVPGADVIVGGHSHTPLAGPVRVNGVVICQAGSHTRFLGRLDLDVADDRVVSFSGRLIPVREKTGQAGPQVTALVREYRDTIEEKFGGTIGRLRRAWTVSQDRECNTGDFFADVIRNKTGADFAVLNSGGIRKGLGRGPVKQMDVLEVYPFENRLVRFTCTGRDILTLVRRNASAAYRKKQILQVSGLSYETRRKSGNRVEITDCRIGGQPVEPAREYTGASVDFIVPGNAKEYMGFEPSESDVIDVTVTGVAVEWIRAHPAVDVRVEGRMKHR
ncbi:MAG: bifunctional UDP-sugar hydrolase/5'-nucleotidase [bacterium]|nr:bifunctional UDP-sugar hydrolase/5'-nucleotidase [bacterium]